MRFATIPELLDELRAGRMVVVVDDEDRENEGDLIMAAELVTPLAINFMITHARGLVCLALTPEQCSQLELPPMVRDNSSRYRTAFTVSIEAAYGVTTGISAHDRARTIRTAVRRDAVPADLARPGHVFPLMAQAEGVLARAGHTKPPATWCDWPDCSRPACWSRSSTAMAAWRDARSWTPLRGRMA